NMRIKIGDPDKLVTGPQRYVISYTVHDGLNPFPDHDELFWNVTGNDWHVPIERASATVVVPGPGVERSTCFQGPTGSTAPCASSSDATSPSFRATESMDAGSGLTIVVGLRKGLVAVGPPSLVPANEDVFDTIGKYVAVKWWTLALAILATIVALTAMARLWWVAGRDRWFGNMYYIREDPPEETKPLLARETIVVEYQPPEARRGRRLRPAEIGLLMDERADTL